MWIAEAVVEMLAKSMSELYSPGRPLHAELLAVKSPTPGLPLASYSPPLEKQGISIRRYSCAKTTTPLSCAGGKFVVQDMVASGEKAAVRVVFHGTHLGDLATPEDPIRATGRRVTMAGLVMYRFANDQIVKTWGCWDVLGLRAQLGTISI